MSFPSGIELTLVWQLLLRGTQIGLHNELALYMATIYFHDKNWTEKETSSQSGPKMEKEPVISYARKGNSYVYADSLFQLLVF